METKKQEEYYVRVVLKGEHLTMFKEVKEVLGVTADTEVCRHALKVLHEKLLREKGRIG